MKYSDFVAAAEEPPSPAKEIELVDVDDDGSQMTEAPVIDIDNPTLIAEVVDIVDDPPSDADDVRVVRMDGKDEDPILMHKERLRNMKADIVRGKPVVKAGVLKDKWVLAKERLLTGIRAYLTISPDHMSAVEKISYACCQQHVQWTIGFQSQTSSSKRKEAWMIVDDVLVLRMCASLSKAEFRTIICDNAVTTMVRKVHEVRGGNLSRNASYALFTCDDRREGKWYTPHGQMFTWHEAQISRLRDRLSNCVYKWRDMPFDTLLKVCDEEEIEMVVDVRVPVQNEPGELTLSLCGVLFCIEPINPFQPKQSEEHGRNLACLLAANLMMKPYMKVYEGSNGLLGLYASNGPITGQIAAILMSQTEIGGCGERFFMQREKLIKIKEALETIPYNMPDSQRLSVACNRVNAPWEICVEANRQPCLIIYGVIVSLKLAPGMLDELRESLCVDALRRLTFENESFGIHPIDAGQLMLTSLYRERVASGRGMRLPKSRAQNPLQTFQQETLKLKMLRNQLLHLSDIENPIRLLDTASCLARVPYTTKVRQVAQSGDHWLQCVVLVSSVIVGRITGVSEDLCKIRACHDAINCLMKSHLSVLNGPMGLELVSSDEPLTQELALSLLRNQNATPEMADSSIFQTIPGLGGAEEYAVKHSNNELQMIGEETFITEISAAQFEDDEIYLDSHDPKDKKKHFIPALGAIEIDAPVDEDSLTNKFKVPANSIFVIPSNVEGETAVTPVCTLPGFILVRSFNESMENARGIINRSAQFSKCRLEFLENDLTMRNQPKFRCTVHIEGQLVQQGTGASKFEAKENACRLAIAKLKENHFTIVVKSSIDKSGDEVNINTIVDDMQSQVSNDLLHPSNVGNRMMRNMGWGGGGIGRDEQGITQPISVNDVYQRQGLGFDPGNPGVTKPFRDGVQSIIMEYMSSNREDDLVFAAELGNDQRAFIHKICRRKGLKTKSYGDKDGKRQLTIQRIRSAKELLEMLLRVGGESGKYIVERPTGVVTSVDGGTLE